MVGVTVHIEFRCSDGPMRISDVEVGAIDYRVGRVLHVIDLKMYSVVASFGSLAVKRGVDIL